jgi:hypothetical protein
LSWLVLLLREARARDTLPAGAGQFAAGLAMHKRGKLWGLWLVPTMLGLVLATAGYVALHHEPSDGSEELAIGIAELRSEAAEAGLIARHGEAGHLTARFVQEQAHQLEKDIRASLQVVIDKGNKAHRPDVTAQVQQLGETALASIEQIAAAPDRTTTLAAAAATMDGTARQLSRMVEALRHQAR